MTLAEITISAHYAGIGGRCKDEDTTDALDKQFQERLKAYLAFKE